LFTAPPLHCVPLYAGSGCCTGAYRHCLANTGMAGLYGTRSGVQSACAFCIAFTAECSLRGTIFCHNVSVTAAVQLHSFLPLALGAVSPLGLKSPVEWKAAWDPDPMWTFRRAEKCLTLAGTKKQSVVQHIALSLN
jgi:hypothetical protein